MEAAPIAQAAALAGNNVSGMPQDIVLTGSAMLIASVLTMQEHGYSRSTMNAISANARITQIADSKINRTGDLRPC